MIDYTVISQLIGSLGFPIVCCGYMMVTNNRTIKQLTEAVSALTVAINTHFVSEHGAPVVGGDTD